jgi:hypothetical protein
MPLPLSTSGEFDIMAALPVKKAATNLERQWPD